MAAVVKQNPEKEVPTEILAQSIVEISKAAKTLRSGRLNEKALLLLLSHSSGESQKTVKNVLHAIETLEYQYVQKAKQ